MNYNWFNQWKEILNPVGFSQNTALILAKANQIIKFRD